MADNLKWTPTEVTKRWGPDLDNVDYSGGLEAWFIPSPNFNNLLVVMDPADATDLRYWNLLRAYSIQKFFKKDLLCVDQENVVLQPSSSRQNQWARDITEFSHGLINYMINQTFSNWT